MTDDAARLPPNLPAVGDELMFNIVEAQMRTTLFPDQTVVASSPLGIDVVFLRNEPRVMAQRVKVVEVHEDGAFRGEPSDNIVEPQIVDIGHVRMSVPLARDTALLLAKRLIEDGHVAIGEFLAQLTAGQEKPVS